MRVPYKWLKEFAPVSASADEVARLLTMRGLEVEGLEAVSPSFTKVITAHIVEMEKHPNADKLTLCRVDTGSEIVSVVCGAPNTAQGQKVALALPGATLAGFPPIEKRAVRGIESFGMLCSERELGLSDDHSGIMLLPGDMKPGVPLGDILEITDYVLDVNVPPNRGDCQSILGIAREAASAFGIELVLPPVDLEEQGAIEGKVDLDILDKEACPRYILRMIEGIAIVPSPYWMRSRIIKCGMRPINSIVDVTNYVMLELGQPLHAFDYKKIGAKRIEVRVAAQKSVFRTLDGTDRTLEQGDILICDGTGPVAVAGIMGGENSEISDDTKDVALESAFFNPLLIRRTARRLDLRSEASSRFEKGIDIENVDYAAKRAIDLMYRTSGGTVLGGSKEVYEKPAVRSIALSAKRAAEVIGTAVTHEQMTTTLASMGIRPTGTDGDRTIFSIPHFRHDITEYYDLIEEIARTIGFDNIPATVPESPLLPVRMGKRDRDMDTARQYLASSGFFEMINYGFFNSDDVVKFLIGESDERSRTVAILNPISKELGVMRTFLAAGVLENIAYNVNRGMKNLKVFEIGKVFFAGNDAPRESMHLCCAMTGKEREYFWKESFKEYDFFDLKGVLEGLLERFNLTFEVRRSDEPFVSAAASADIYLNGRKIGWMGELTQSVPAAYEMKEKVLAAELDIDIVSETGTDERAYTQIPRYPAVTRDFSFYVDDAIPVGELITNIKEVSPLIVSVNIFDMFKKEVRSIAFRVVFQSYEDTLTDEKVNGLQQIIIDRLTKIEGIKLRT
jgi:phenylalanyl-tRNA synthetase beta chain